MIRPGRPQVENPKKKRVSMRVNEEDYQKITSHAKKQGMTVANLLKEAVFQYMENNFSI